MRNSLSTPRRTRWISRDAVRADAGFTLVELLAVMAILLLLIGLTIGLTSGVSAKRSEARAQADLAAIAQALEKCHASIGDYPWVGTSPLNGGAVSSRGSAEMLRTLAGHRSVDPDRPQLRRNTVFLDLNALEYDGGSYDPNGDVDPGGAFPVDPWGNPYLYLYNPSYPKSSSAWRNPGYILLSAGPDGEISLPGANVNRTGLVDTDAYEADPVNADNVVFKM